MSALLQVFSVLIKKPFFAVSFGVIMGIVVGLTMGWGIWPVEFTDATPEVLRADLQEEYMRMAIDSFRVNGDPILVEQRYRNIGPNATQIFLNIQNSPRQLDPAAVQNFGQIVQNLVEAPVSTVGGTEDAQATPIGNLIITVSIVLVLAVILFLGIYIYRKIFRGNPRGVASAAMQAAEVSRQAEKTDFQTLGLAPPVTQTMTTYVLGDDLYDESFSIDTQGGEFLGEYGAGVSETIGVGEPKKVTALEIWLFDKNDIKTATKVLMSEHAYNDADLRARLEAKGELILIESQDQVVLETASLQLLVTVSDLKYGSGAMPEASYFERVTLELAVWPKE